MFLLASFHHLISLSTFVGYVYVSCSAVSQLFATLWTGSSVRGILQARILEWVAVPSSGASSRPRGRTCISCIGRWIPDCCAPREARLLAGRVSCLLCGWAPAGRLLATLLACSQVGGDGPVNKQLAAPCGQ